MLRFWAQDDEGNEVFSRTREYGFNFYDPEGNEPGMVDNVAGRGFEEVLEAEATRREEFIFPHADGGELDLHATLTYIFFVLPPPEAMNRIQQGVIARREAAATQAEKDQILFEEIPGRMRSMNVLDSNYPPVVMATAETRIE